MKEALYYQKLGEQRVHCNLCPHECQISEGKTGLCEVRKNIGGTLFALTYGKVVSVCVDPIEKKPLNHFYPGASAFSIGTFGCNMRCLHCQNWQISHHCATEDGDGLSDLSPAQAVALALEHRCEVIAYTYNEPSIWIEYVLETSKLAREKGLKNVLVTSGMINPEPLKDLLAVTDAYRLDIKGFTEDFYKRLTGMAVLGRVLGNAKLALAAGCHIEIITNIIPNWNDSDEQLGGLAQWIVENLGPDIPWHLTRYYPYFKMTEPQTPVATLDRARQIGLNAGMRHVFVGNVPGHPDQSTLCHQCNKTLIDRRGYSIGEIHILKGCCSYCGAALGHYRGRENPEAG